jgi:ornithine carbamoyltransferase
VKPRHFLTLLDLTPDELRQLIGRARELKAMHKRGERHTPLAGKTMAMIFEKSSTRTRVSFEAGMAQLGGTSLFLSPRDTHLDRGEPVEDTARVMSRMVDVIVIRANSHAMVERFAAHSRVPVINGLTNEYHPCQILADIYTYVEHRGSIRGRTVAWIGDGNNMCYTWLQAAPLLGFKVHVSAPPGYTVDATRAGAEASGHWEAFAEPEAACRGADLVTTDVWTSMGFEAENETRKRDFARWMVDAAMMREAKTDALFMHCLPAHRGEEVAADVIDGPQSVVWDEAENRLHAQKALLEYLVCGRVEAPDRA